MTARVLVVDDIPVNIKVLEAKLSAEYFEVLTASSGLQALDVCARERCAGGTTPLCDDGNLCTASAAYS